MAGGLRCRRCLPAAAAALVVGMAGIGRLASPSGFLTIGRVPSGSLTSAPHVRRDFQTTTIIEDVSPFGFSATLFGTAVAAAALVRAASATGRARSGAARHGSPVLCRAKENEVEDDSVAAMVIKFEDKIKIIKDAITDLPQEYDDIKLLRFAMQHKEAKEDSIMIDNVKDVIAWRKGEGKTTVDAARRAVRQAMDGGKWNNTPVLNAAPHRDKVTKHITPKQMLVVSTASGDLVTAIQAASIDSAALMDEVTEEELTAFFMYAREVNSLVAEKRTRKSGRVHKLLSANDLTGVKSFPDKRFSAALTGSATKANELYPGFSGPTLILNLPWLARLLVQFLTPLFPGAVRDKIRFAKQPMPYLANLEDVTKQEIKDQFADDLKMVLEQNK